MEKTNNVKLILASASPRRIELLQKLNIPFDVMPADIDEIVDSSLDPEEIVRILAQQKAEHIAKSVLADSEAECAAHNATDCATHTLKYTATQDKRYRSEKIFVIGADTAVVAQDGTIMGKPKDETDAWHMHRALSGAKHRVMTGVAIFSAQGEMLRSFTEVTLVEFYPLSDNMINAYIESGEWSGKAGAYAIQGEGALFVKRIDGCFYNVVGLPVARLKQELQELQKL